MVLRLSTHFDVTPERFEHLGVLNAYLGIDTKVFIDPVLLRSTKIPEFRNAKDELSGYFSGVIKLLATTKQRNDLAWREAVKKLRFREEHGAAIGYAAAGGSGRGVGKQLGETLAERVREIIDLGITDPEILEIIGLFQEGFGADLLSDMAISILKSRFLAFTQRVATELNLQPTKSFSFHRAEWELPIHPETKAALILIPDSLLSQLPVALDRGEIDEVAQFNADLRASWTSLLKKAITEKRKPSKSEIREILLADPKNLVDLIEVYKKAAQNGYNFKMDPHGLFNWDYYGRRAAEKYPLAILQKKPETIAELRQVLNLIVAQFKKNIEENKLYEVLYGEDRKARNEVYGQRLFYAIADSYCAANDVDLSREPNAGNGPVDFKLSVGYRGRILVEVKKSTNTKLIHGFETQLQAYQAAEMTEESLYLILRVSNGEKGISDVLALRDEKLGEGFRVPDVVVIDARLTPSASKR